MNKITKTILIISTLLIITHQEEEIAFGWNAYVTSPA
jgi:hypothetical protein